MWSISRNSTSWRDGISHVFCRRDPWPLRLHTVINEWADFDNMRGSDCWRWVKTALLLYVVYSLMSTYVSRPMNTRSSTAHNCVYKFMLMITLCSRILHICFNYQMRRMIIANFIWFLCIDFYGLCFRMFLSLSILPGSLWSGYVREQLTDCGGYWYSFHRWVQLKNDSKYSIVPVRWTGQWHKVWNIS